jgi:hypothetical protein
MASQKPSFESHQRLYRPRIWPSERQPTRWDVHDANELPPVTFLDRFRVALLHSEDSEDDMLLDSELVIDASETTDLVG